VLIKKNKFRVMLQHVNVGLSFGVAMAIRLALGFYGGQWLDRRLGTDPWFTLAGVLLAIGLSFHHLITEFSKVNSGGNSDDTSEDE